jgi:hypothetical protein
MPMIQPLWSDQAKDYIFSICCLHDDQAASIIGKTKNDCFEIGIMYPNGVTGAGSTYPFGLHPEFIVGFVLI